MNATVARIFGKAPAANLPVEPDQQPAQPMRLDSGSHPAVMGAPEETRPARRRGRRTGGGQALPAASLHSARPITFDPGLAQLLGIEEAVILNQFHWWLDENRRRNQNLHDGRYWTYNSLAAWHRDYFQYMPFRGMRQALERLRKKGILIAGKYNREKRDQTLWYSIDYQALVDLGVQVPEDSLPELQKPADSHLSETTNACVRSDRPLPVVYIQKSKSKSSDTGVPVSEPSTFSSAEEKSATALRVTVTKDGPWQFNLQPSRHTLEAGGTLDRLVDEVVNYLGAGLSETLWNTITTLGLYVKMHTKAELIRDFVRHAILENAARCCLVSPSGVELEAVTRRWFQIRYRCPEGKDGSLQKLFATYDLYWYCIKALFPKDEAYARSVGEMTNKGMIKRIFWIMDTVGKLDVRDSKWDWVVTGIDDWMLNLERPVGLADFTGNKQYCSWFINWIEGSL